MAKNDQKCQFLLKTMAKRRVIKFGGAWNYILMLKIWYHRQISNFGDGISFGHNNMKLVVRAKMAKNYQKYQISVKTMVVHET
jgi:hypothetical protein